MTAYFSNIVKDRDVKFVHNFDSRIIEISDTFGSLFIVTFDWEILIFSSKRYNSDLSELTLFQGETNTFLSIKRHFSMKKCDFLGFQSTAIF